MPELTLPATASQWLPLIAPLATLVAGFLFFLAPARMLGHLGLKGGPSSPEAFGEGRSRFAGFLIGLPACALLLAQPVLFQMVGIAWMLAAAGKLVNIALDGARGASVFIRLGLAAGLGVLVLAQTGRPEVAYTMPVTRPEWLIAGVGMVTVMIGAAAFLLPGAVVKAMRLTAGTNANAGELRGSLAGFHLATGLAALLAGGIFVQLALGAGWLMTAFGRMISMLSDGANNLRNWLLLVVELVLGAVPVAVVFGFVQ